MGLNFNQYLVLDWGYTRLKLWALNHYKEITSYESFNTVDISKNPIFYDSNDLSEVGNKIKIFISKNIDTEKKIHFLFSTQMHGISGEFKNGNIFFSSWNDLPVKKDDILPYAKNGIPKLHSMPVNKIKKKKESYYLLTNHTKENFHFYDCEIKTLNSPFELIFKKFFNIEIDISTYLIASTCITSKKVVSLFNKRSVKKQENSFLNSAKINANFYPEIGDLQASTYSALKNSEIVINLGTGSQILFKKRNEFNSNFFRLFPNYGKIYTISHIPCGRLLNDYCIIKKYKFNKIIESLKTLDKNKFFKILKSNNRNLLFFPGFDAYSLSYLNEPLISIENISKLKINELIVLWLFQYLHIINQIYDPKKINSEILITITGSLGGITKPAINLLNQLFPNKYYFNLSEFTLPNSLIDTLDSKID